MDMDEPLRAYLGADDPYEQREGFVRAQDHRSRPILKLEERTAEQEGAEGAATSAAEVVPTQRVASSDVISIDDDLARLDEADWDLAGAAQRALEEHLERTSGGAPRLRVA